MYKYVAHGHWALKVTDSYFYQTNTALYPVKSENSPTTADDRSLLRKQKVYWLL